MSSPKGVLVVEVVTAGALDPLAPYPPYWRHCTLHEIIVWNTSLVVLFHLYLDQKVNTSSSTFSKNWTAKDETGHAYKNDSY